MDMLLLRTIISSVAIIIAANLGLCFCGCARAAYEIDGDCCPMCAPGNRVYWPCTADTSTTCVPCPTSEYTDEPNGLGSCFRCTVCDPDHRLKVQKACTRSADTVCEPQEGFYCIKLNKDSCASAVEHSACKPGQYIKQTGTAFSDTVCADCIDGSYSDGSLMACLPHSKCETMGLTEVKAGTTSSDAECEKVTSVGLIAGVTAAVLIAVIVALSACFIYRKRKAWGSNEGVWYIQQATEDPYHSTVTEWNAQDCGISQSAKDTSMLPSKFDQKKVPPETRSEAEFGFRRALMLSCLGMLPPKELSDTNDISPFKEIGAALACPRGLSKMATE